MATNTLIRGFDDAVHDAQRAFRQVLKAMSEPGTAVRLDCPESPAGMAPASFALCQSLLDSETALWRSNEFRRDAIGQNLRFHTGVRLTEKRGDATFALAYPSELDSLEGFSRGSAEYPETGTTLILQVELSEDGNRGQCLRLCGPGIETERRICIAGLEGTVLDYLLERPDPFPQGLDLMLVDGERLICIPRTTVVEVC